MTSIRYRYEVSCADGSGSVARSTRDDAGLFRKLRWCVRQDDIMRITIERHDLNDLKLDYGVDANEVAAGADSQRMEPTPSASTQTRAASTR